MLDYHQYLLNYLRRGEEKSSLSQHIDMLKLELDWHIYHYGQHFSIPREGHPKNISLYKKIRKIYHSFKSSPRDIIVADKKNILSLIYFDKFNTQMEDADFNLVSPYWGPVGDKVIGNPEIRRMVELINNSFQRQSFSYLISEEFQTIISEFNEQVYKLVAQYDLRALFLYTDQLFYSKSAIRAFKKLGRPSVVLSHGLPGIYHPNAEGNSDYLLVWGPAIKENYVKCGFSPSRVLVSGHPSYNPEIMIAKFRFDFDNILVLAKATSPHQHSYEPILHDRGNLIVYLLMIKSVLIKLGVKKAKLRPHPTMSKEWLLLYLGNDFFELDYLPLPHSLSKSSLVIGPTSTVLLDSLLKKVNYVVFDPVNASGKDLTGYELVPPFDGSDPLVPVARTEEELFELLSKKEGVNPNMLKDYLTPFDTSVIKKIIK